MKTNMECSNKIQTRIGCVKQKRKKKTPCDIFGTRIIGKTWKSVHLRKFCKVLRSDGSKKQLTHVEEHSCKKERQGIYIIINNIYTGIVAVFTKK